EQSTGDEKKNPERDGDTKSPLQKAGKSFRVCGTEKEEWDEFRKRFGFVAGSHRERNGGFVSRQRNLVWRIWRAWASGIRGIFARIGHHRIPGGFGPGRWRNRNADRNFRANRGGVHSDCDAGRN